MVWVTLLFCCSWPLFEFVCVRSLTSGSHLLLSSGPSSGQRGEVKGQGVTWHFLHRSETTDAHAFCQRNYLLFMSLKFLHNKCVQSFLYSQVTNISMNAVYILIRYDTVVMCGENSNWHQTFWSSELSIISGAHLTHFSTNHN